MAFEARAKGKDWKPEWTDDQTARATAALQRKGIASYAGDADTKKLWLSVEWAF